MECTKCKIPMRPEPWAKIVSPNVYRLFDKYICPQCKILKTVDLGTIDKNTEGTRRHMQQLAEKRDKKTKVFKEKPVAYPYKDDVENDEIDTKELF